MRKAGTSTVRPGFSSSSHSLSTDSLQPMKKGPPGTETMPSSAAGATGGAGAAAGSSMGFSGA